MRSPLQGICDIGGEIAGDAHAVGGRLGGRLLHLHGGIAELARGEGILAQAYGQADILEGFQLAITLQPAYQHADGVGTNVNSCEVWQAVDQSCMAASSLN